MPPQLHPEVAPTSNHTIRHLRISVFRLTSSGFRTSPSAVDETSYLKRLNLSCKIVLNPEFLSLLWRWELVFRRKEDTVDKKSPGPGIIISMPD